MEKDQSYVLDNVATVPESGCWLWDKSWMPTGYGQFQFKNKHYYAHRYSYQTFKGNIDEGLCVLHKCDTRSCVNPDHLFLGTKKDNIVDAKNKGRLNPSRGSRNYLAKLDEDKVTTIRASCKSNKDLAEEYGVDSSVISEVKNRKIWRHV